MRQPVVLLIGGKPSQAALLHRHFQEAGYQVFAVDCSARVPEMLAQAQPKLAVLDWDLPDLSALEVIRTIRSQPGFTRLPIILTGREISCENRILSLEAGVDFCLDGVVRPAEILARIRALLRRVV